MQDLVNPSKHWGFLFWVEMSCPHFPHSAAPHVRHSSIWRHGQQEARNDKDTILGNRHLCSISRLKSDGQKQVAAKVVKSLTYLNLIGSTGVDTLSFVSQIQDLNIIDV
ncbi:MAG: hypothetical protein GY878_22050 [Fuerstiella sp.]|nr:hypothetical protein [Fuerstiella sp.]